MVSPTPTEYIPALFIASTPAAASSIIKAERGSNHRWLELTVKYRDREELVTHEMAWTPESRTVVLVDATRLSNIDETAPTITEGVAFAAKLAPPEGKDVEINANGTGYYQRFIPVLERFKASIGGELTDAPLSMGDDVNMHDMVACASPGWSEAYDIPRSNIQAICVKKHSFALRKLFPSSRLSRYWYRPAVWPCLPTILSKPAATSACVRRSRHLRPAQ